MSLDSIGVNTTAEITTTSTATGTTALDKDAFLLLLTTQLQNQDPTEPMSNQEFVAQLAQFSQLEELQAVSGQLDSLYLVNVSMNNASMANLLGQDVVARSGTFNHTSGSEEIYFDADGETASTTLTITDADGAVVFSADIGAQEAGEGSYTWDGKDQDGQLVADGDYTFTITATGTDGSEVSVDTLIQGTIDEMSFETGSAAPSVEGVDITMGDIVRLIEPSS